MIEIQLDDEFKITVDEQNYILQRKGDPDHKKSKGDPVFYPEAYYQRMDYLLERYLELKSRNIDARTLKEYVAEIKEILSNRLKALEAIFNDQPMPRYRADLKNVTTGTLDSSKSIL